jgi:light-regulated signal transduction histidine kinase (bacteriophytochrome)
LPREQMIAQMQAQGAALVTNDRAELIRQAMQVRAAKQSLLADLNDEDRAKLVATAMRAFLNEGKSKA